MSARRKIISNRSYKKEDKRKKNVQNTSEKESAFKVQNKDKKSSQKPVTGRRLWLFRIVSVTVVPVLLILLFELGLRIAGYGFTPDAIIKCKVDSEVCYCDNVKFCWRFFPKEIAREFNPFVFPADKAENTYRIFVMGASAAQGEPDGAFGFGRILQVMLREKYPGINFEVIIAATAAINSHVVVEIARDCAKHEPDLFVVYLGNNEVTGPYGAGTVFAPLSPSLSVIRMGIAVKATRLGQLLTNFVGWVGMNKNHPVSWRGLEMFLDKQIRADSPNLETVYRHFKSNLEDIVQVGLNSGANIIISTIGSNLRDNPPFASLHRQDMTDAERGKFDKLYQQGVEYENTADYTRALEQYARATEVDNSYADLQFRLGKCYWNIEEYEKSKQSYIHAREMDTLRFRSDNRINEIIREVAAGNAGKGVYLADAVKTFEQNSPHGITGEELFYEHVHLNFEGNYLLAKTVFEKVEKLLPERIKVHKTENSLPMSLTECANRLAYTQWDQYVIADEVIKRFISLPPFTNQLYHRERIEILEQRCRALEVDLTPEALKKSSEVYQQAIQDAPQDLYLRWKYGRLLVEDFKDYKAAAEQFKFIKKAIPHSYVAYDALGSVMRATGNIDAAVSYYLTAIRIKPTCGDAHYYLGLIYQQNGKTEKAAEHYSEAIRFMPNYVLAYNNLAELYYRQDKIDEAIEICRRGVMFIPDNPLLRCSLGILLLKQGQRDAAVEELKASLEIDPNFYQSRTVLESIMKNTPD